MHFAPRAKEFIGVDISADSLRECARQVDAVCDTPFRPVVVSVAEPETAAPHRTESGLAEMTTYPIAAFWEFAAACDSSPKRSNWCRRTTSMSGMPTSFCPRRTLAVSTIMHSMYAVAAVELREVMLWWARPRLTGLVRRPRGNRWSLHAVRSGGDMPHDIEERRAVGSSGQ